MRALEPQCDRRSWLRQVGELAPRLRNRPQPKAGPQHACALMRRHERQVAQLRGGARLSRPEQQPARQSSQPRRHARRPRGLGQQMRHEIASRQHRSGGGVGAARLTCRFASLSAIRGDTHRAWGARQQSQRQTQRSRGRPKDARVRFPPCRRLITICRGQRWGAVRTTRRKRFDWQRPRQGGANLGRHAPAHHLLPRTLSGWLARRLYSRHREDEAVPRQHAQIRARRARRSLRPCAYTL